MRRHSSAHESSMVLIEGGTVTEDKGSVPRRPSEPMLSGPFAQQQTSGMSGGDENGSTIGSGDETLYLVLRMRNSKRELNDIRFEYIPGKDTAEGIASELVSASLVDDRDFAAITASLQKLISNRGQIRHLTFPLSSGLPPSETPDDKSLIGFAQMSISDTN